MTVRPCHQVFQHSHRQVFCFWFPSFCSLSATCTVRHFGFRPVVAKLLSCVMVFGSFPLYVGVSTNAKAALQKAGLEDPDLFLALSDGTDIEWLQALSEFLQTAVGFSGPVLPLLCIRNRARILGNRIAARIRAADLGAVLQRCPTWISKAQGPLAQPATTSHGRSTIPPSSHHKRRRLSSSSPVEIENSNPLQRVEHALRLRWVFPTGSHPTVGR